MSNVDRQEAERFVSALYLGVLNRAADAEGFSHHVDAILRGSTHAAIIEEFLVSAEYQALQKEREIKLFVPPGHFYSPITNPDEADAYLKKLETISIPDAIPGIALDRVEMIQTWRDLLPFLTSAPFAASSKAGFHYAFENESYSWGDGSILHAMLRQHRPKQVIEVGSGWSSACTIDTIEKYFDEPCELTFIEPYPQLLRSLIGEAAARVHIFEQPVQQIPLATFDRLKAGDFIFIDSTHILRTGSDVCFELFEILPRLASGVFVHFHDMFWPFEYPRSWVVDENRSWNELYALRAFLTQNDGWRIVMFNNYMEHFERSLIESTYPQFLRNSGGALWLQKK